MGTLATLAILMRAWSSLIMFMKSSSLWRRLILRAYRAWHASDLLKLRTSLNRPRIDRLRAWCILFINTSMSLSISPRGNHWPNLNQPRKMGATFCPSKFPEALKFSRILNSRTFSCFLFSRSSNFLSRSRKNYNFGKWYFYSQNVFNVFHAFFLILSTSSPCFHVTWVNRSEFDDFDLCMFTLLSCQHYSEIVLDSERVYRAISISISVPFVEKPCLDPKKIFSW